VGTPMLTDEEIKKIKVRLEDAFNPLRCVAEVWDYKQKLRFKVFDHNDQGIIEMPEIVLRDLNVPNLNRIGCTMVRLIS
jgi:hypothetical protein